MKLNTRSRIAIHAMLDVAVHGTHVPVALASVSARQEVSLSYLEQLFRRLRVRGLVKSSRGPGGGYQLNKRLSAISVADVVEIVDHEADGQPRAGRRREPGAGAVDQLWMQLDRHLLDYLHTVTLETVLTSYRAGQQRGPLAETGRRPLIEPGLRKRLAVGA